MNPNLNHSPFVYKVYICQNGKCAASSNARSIYEKLLGLIHEYGLDDYDSPIRIKCNLSGCLDVCKNGPVMVVHPGAVYYQHVDQQAIERIFSLHFIGGKVVKELTFERKPTDSEENR